MTPEETIRREPPLEPRLPSIEEVRTQFNLFKSDRRDFRPSDIIQFDKLMAEQARKNGHAIIEAINLNEDPATYPVVEV
ncbi:MAG: hypothetical protein ACXWLH_02670 [Candidatus Saccharimonadales bacterium]